MVFSYCNLTAVVAEWLRRLTRNQIPYGSAGSNPAGCVLVNFFYTNIKNVFFLMFLSLSVFKT